MLLHDMQAVRIQLILNGLLRCYIYLTLKYARSGMWIPLVMVCNWFGIGQGI